MYGHRARMGYACPPKVAEVFVYEFYKIAPPGVTLALSTVGGGRATLEQLQESFRLSIQAAETLAKTGVDSVVLGGEPLNASMGPELETEVEALRQRFGIPVSTSMTAQARALEVLGAQRIAVIRYGESYGEGDVVPDSVEVVASISGGLAGGKLATIPIDVPARLCREAVAKHPEIDTIKIRTAHWATLEVIDSLEQELGVNIVSASQCITWEGLRQAGVTDSIPACGRLLREH